MAMISTLVAAAGVAIAGAGLYMNYEAGQDKADADQAAIAAQQEQQQLRKQQMDLDATRRRREILRQSVAARSASLAITTAQGAAVEGGSALPGAQGSIAGRFGVNTVGVNQNQAIGWGMFDAHSDQLTAYSQAADAQSRQSFAQGLSSLGGAMITNAGSIGKIGSFTAGKIGQALAPEGGYTGWTSGGNN
jgi:hypothetical protein